MISSSVRSGRNHRARNGRAATRALFVSVLALLLATGWVANHFVALMPVISGREHLSTATLDGIFGIYALGLLPGLLIGGRASDALGRRPMALAGAAATVAGTVAMLLSQHTGALLVGRLVVGVGVGLAISSGTAWASDLRGPAGAATAGAVLTAGFAIGPFAGGGFAWAGQSGIQVSFAVAAAIVVLASLAVAVAATPGAHVARPAPPPDAGPTGPTAQGVSRALSWAMPLAPWVYASATLGFVTIPTRLHTALAAPIAAGTATLIVNGVSGVVQVLARTRRWGPQTGTAGAALAAVGYVVAATTPPALTPAVGIPLLLILGCASGLCLREGLIDLEAAAPQHLRGALTGVFYVVTYIGFALPLLLATADPGVSAAILSAMAALASVSAVGRAMRLRRDSHRQN
ncbi:MFS transporter [Mycobacterium intracellulare]|uniref:MFS transporter n=1 Tax=Mycobacterium intracellulare TaxID=1767 RepID=UPI000BAAFB35|nr:MFS transporter [Mycobacterium intracellulare]ASW93409.1 MFS transporter [Mycobacterium intracellulare]MCA2233384.1 MFS transporter [Mycobacterium intracellulare]MCA2246698.1 MFS transporter [Mycobacterium intracellulare]MCA2357323.1 MFS transporter [Mycobacterium intracellulare]MCA2368445.1 MFS transporter [Mycobacterium intracellulare]